MGNLPPPCDTVLRVLIVDRDPTVLDELAKGCQKLGMDVAAARDAESGLTQMNYADPDLACIDGTLRLENGQRLCSALATDPAWANRPTIVLLPTSQGHEDCPCRQLPSYRIVRRAPLWLRVEPLLFELLPLTV